MFKFFKRFFLAILTIATVGFFAAMLLFFWYAPSCDGDSESAKYVRNLDSERLSKLYDDMYRYYHNSSQDRHRKIPKADLPEEFSDLQIVSLTPLNAQIMVVGCYDNYMYLDFNGIKDSQEKAIILRYGEVEISKEKIWPK